jgi:hypothetical protein
MDVICLFDSGAGALVHGYALLVISCVEDLPPN